MLDFPEFRKIPRWNRQVTVTEKIDGTNAMVAILTENEWHEYDDPPPVYITLDNLGRRWYMCCGSRAEWINHHNDNEGFARWARDNGPDLYCLGPGLHRGEWYGNPAPGTVGTGKPHRDYGLVRGDMRFMLFNPKWADEWAEVADRTKDGQQYRFGKPMQCETATVLWRGMAADLDARDLIEKLKVDGSAHVPGYAKPEGIVIFHSEPSADGGSLFKMTCEKDDEWKGRERPTLAPDARAFIDEWRNRHADALTAPIEATEFGKILVA